VLVRFVKTQPLNSQKTFSQTSYSTSTFVITFAVQMCEDGTKK